MPSATHHSIGYRMPAEWEPHEGTFLGWPHELTDWPGKFAPIPWAFAEIVRHLARVERVFLLVENVTAESRVKIILHKSHVNVNNVQFLRVPTDRGWMRDSGPICVANKSGQVAFDHFFFNGWAKYDNHKRDAQAVSRINKSLRRKILLPIHNGRRVVLEGGSIDVNGLGTLLTTEECLQSSLQERNPGFAKREYEDVFRNYFGVTNVLWLRNGIAGDDTHGHVDDLSRFVDPGTVVTIVEENRDDANYPALQENLALLKSMKDQDGKPLRIEVLPMPAPVFFNGQRLRPATTSASPRTGCAGFQRSNDRNAPNTLARFSSTQNRSRLLS
jgi:agmatine deiminase